MDPNVTSQVSQIRSLLRDLAVTDRHEVEADYNSVKDSWEPTSLIIIGELKLPSMLTAILTGDRRDGFAQFQAKSITDCPARTILQFDTASDKFFRGHRIARLSNGKLALYGHRSMYSHVGGLLAGRDSALAVSATRRPTCPHCSAKLRLTRPVAKALRVSCPACQRSFVLNPASLTIAPRPFDMGPRIAVQNRWGLGDGGPFSVYQHPDLARLFRDDQPEAPFPVNRQPSYWQRQSRSARLAEVVAAYCEHPDPHVRAQIPSLAEEIDADIVTQCLVNLLADPHPPVQREAARVCWQRHSGELCHTELKVLRDEIRGHSCTVVGATPEGLMLDRQRAIASLDRLVDHVRQAHGGQSLTYRDFQKLVNELIVIEDRLQEVDIASVVSVGIQRNGPYTYEVYRADSRQQAFAFLKTKSVAKECYYIEVETPQGNVGRDIRGLYDV